MIQVVKEIPKLLKCWDFEYNNYLDIETTKVNSKISAHWRCPHCFYSWEDTIFKIYTRSTKHDNFCPCCSLGEVLIKEKNSILAVYPCITQYLNFHYENKKGIIRKLNSEKFNSKQIFYLKCPTCHIGWRDRVTNQRLFQSENKEIFHIDCNEWSSQFYYHEVYPNLNSIYHQERNEVDFNDLMLNHNVTIPHHWKCHKCHYEFEAAIDTLFSRIKNKGIYCTDCQASFDKPLEVKSTEDPLSFINSTVLAEWSEDNLISPSQVDSLSNIEVYWKCSTCHGKYACAVYQKTQQSCPYCSGEKMLQGFNTLEVTHPYLKIFWNCQNPNNLNDFWEKSHDILNWFCPCCEVQFDCSPSEMISRTDLDNQNFQTCPNMCDWRREIFKDEILHDYQDLLNEWSDKNEIPIHLAITHIETKKYWWHCSICKGDYQCSIPIRKEVEDTCPYCNHEKPLKGFNTLLDLYPDLANMWSPKNNVKLEIIVPNNTEKRQTTWNCKTCDLEFEEHFNVVLNNYITNGESTHNICPYCTKCLPDPRTDSLDIVKPFLINEWIAELNGDISKEFPDSERDIKWRCRKCCGEFEAKICDRKESDGICPYCSGKKLLPGFNSFADLYPDLLTEWDYLNNILLANPNEINIKSHAKVWWVCKNNYEHRYKLAVNKRLEYDKRKKEPCTICKGLRRKREHFVPYKPI